MVDTEIMMTLVGADEVGVLVDVLLDNPVTITAGVLCGTVHRLNETKLEPFDRVVIAHLREPYRMLN